ncbi:MAG TPA: hypothetical protein VFP17_03475, partial [Solirubrobacterales bacterium]|nr:hypothetical protein [Solirubrobacterales bacterium]
MNTSPSRRRFDVSFIKELPKMSKRVLSVAAFVAVAFLVVPTVAAASPSPWWQVLTGSHPTNLWEPEDGVQEIETGLVEIFGAEVAAAKIEVGGETVGCLGVESEVGSLVCEFVVGFAPTETAEQLEALLKEKFGTNGVKVTGGPVGGENFKIVTSGATPALQISEIELEPNEPIGRAKLKVITEGGSGRLILTLTNLGDAELDATTTPVTITDELPEGVIATGVEAVAGFANEDGPVECKLESSTVVACLFEGTLPSYEGIEVEVLASLTGSPPAAGAPGTVTVSGGNAPVASADQSIEVSPEETPFGIEKFSSHSEEEGGGDADRAGSRPFQVVTTLQLNTGRFHPVGPRFGIFDQPALPRNLSFSLPAGLVGSAKSLPQCKMRLFFESNVIDNCPMEAAIGVASLTVNERRFLNLQRLAVPVFNLPPTQGEPARLGFIVKSAPVVIDTSVDPDNGYRIVASVKNVTQLGEFISSTVTLWGTPGDPRHDSSRGWNCISRNEPVEPCVRPPGLGEEPFLREPVSCVTSRNFKAVLEPWNVPLGSVIKEAFYDDGMVSSCNQVQFNPKIAASPTGSSAGSSSGLDFRLDMPNSWPAQKDANAEGQAKKVEVTLPEGVTVNPSQANGLGACTPADYAREAFDSAPGVGCPESSKIGSVDIKTLLLEEEAHGSVFVAAPFDNPFGSLLALYVVAKIPERGVLVKQAGKVELNPDTGQVVTTFDDLPQIPFETFNLHFKEGDRAPLVMPSSCGTYDLTARFTPWNAADPNNPQPNEIVTKTSPFTVDHGPNGAQCPSGTPPFHPGFIAGTESNSAGSYSPLKVRLTREDGEQEFSRFSLQLPKGVIGNLSGIPFCSEAGIAQARSRTGANGGQEELEHPSCPAASQIGQTSVGAGVGQALTYVPGSLYLAGPYQGAKLSAVAITPAKVGPFDLGDVVIRQALKV